MKKERNPFKLDVVSIRLVKDTPLCSGYPINTPEDAVLLIGEKLCEMDREVVCVINMRADNRPINCMFVSIGTVNSALVHPRELFKSAILSNAAKLLIVHNHPSGNLIPSKEDSILTDRMTKLCMYMEMPLIDHIIVGGDNTEFFSFKEKGILPNPKPVLMSDYHNIDFSKECVAERGKAR